MSTANDPVTTAAAAPRLLPVAAATDLAIVIAGIVVAHMALQAADVHQPGLSILLPLALATWRLHARASNWGDLGLARLPGVAWLAGWSAAAFFGAQLLVMLVVGPLTQAAGWPPIRTATLGLAGGDGLALARMLLIGWTSAAFGEEMLNRGFLLTRIEQALGSSRSALYAAVLLQALEFALGHLYLGPTGAAIAGAVGAVSGAIYIACGRNLWPVIIAHGVTDTLGLTLVWLGVGVA